jgi:pilus assembly protein CpaC
MLLKPSRTAPSLPPRQLHRPTATFAAALPAALTAALAATSLPPALAAPPTTVAAAPRTAPVRAPAVAAPATPPAPAMTSSPCGRVAVGPMVNIPVGKSTVIRPETPVARILLGNPENARAARPVESPDAAKDDGVKSPGAANRPGVADVDVLLLGPSEVYLLGKTIGSTNIVMIDREGLCTAFDVVVGMDTSALQSVIGQVLPGEKLVRVSAAFDSVVLSGSVSDAEALTRVTDLANAYLRGTGSSGGAAGNPRIVNMLSLDAPQQVLLEVKVAEVSKRLLDQFGIDFSRAFVSGDASVMRFLSGLFGGAAGAIGTITGTGPGVPLSSVGTVVGGTVSGVPGASGGNVTVTYDNNGRPTYNTTYGTVPGTGVTNIGLNMQKTDGLVKVLAEPSIMAISGQTGSFLAGGTIFIPVAQTGNGVVGGGAGAVTLEEKDFGVSVKFTPTVLGNGRINLKVRPEVSELNPNGVSLRGLGGSAILPSLISRKAETTVQLMDGQSFAIGGLIKNNTITNVSAFPFLGELPIIGVLFRSTEFQTDRSELVFIITPRLVKPLPTDYRLPTDNYVPPTRTELIWEGKTEGRPPQAPAPAPGTPATQTSAPTPRADAAATVPAAPPGGGFDTQKPE